MEDSVENISPGQLPSVDLKEIKLKNNAISKLDLNLSIYVVIESHNLLRKHVKL